jgi:uncharacterized Zn-binding protein involved in type VI secretion
MKEAARVTDPTVHTGTVVAGAAHTQIAGLAAARKGDAHACPAHGPGVIIEGSSTVIIEGAQAARKLDKCGCVTVGTPGQGVPAVCGPGSPGLRPLQWASDGRMDADTDYRENARGPHVEGEVQDTDQDGTYDTVRGEASAIRFRNQGYRDVGPVEVGVRHNLDVFYARGQAGASEGNNFGSGVNAGAEAGAWKQGVEFSVGPAGDNGRNPYQAVGAEYDLFHAEARVDVLNGDDGRRVGYGFVAKAGAEVLGGNVNERTTIPLPFGWNIQTRGKLGGTAVSVGAAAGGWAFWDRQEGRFHLGILGELKVLLGLELDFDISIGRAYADPNAQAPPGGGTPGTGSGGVPNAIARGCPTVLIGG